ncbi:hypothetical protein QQ020_09265 [Fulvivirgaceae bacterium BMA12]|uniref:Lipoprotein n=1 Tax=Agaribacillus aureus TaxID=3051825 RepID=A0ABT8L600_9BACT|nr:hypothetical protein [Fulvivirgaceae bacterium BMA12]
MKKNHYIFIFCLLLCCQEPLKLSGLWYSPYNYRLKISDSVAMHFDTSFHVSGFLLNFTTKDTVEFIGRDTAKAYWTISEKTNKISIVKEANSFKGQYYPRSHILLVDSSQSWDTRYYRVEPLGQSSMPDNLQLYNELTNNMWRISMDTDEANYIEIIFGSNGNNILVQISHNRSLYTRNAIVSAYKYKNHYFLSLVTTNGFEEYLFHIKGKQKKNFEVGFYNFSRQQPEFHNVEMRKLNIIDQSKQDELKNTLIGTWRADDGYPVKADYFLNLQEYFDDYWKVKFVENSFKIEFGGKTIIENKTVSHAREIIGTWNLGENGKFIKLHSENRTDLASLKFLENNKICLTMDVEQINEENSFFGDIEFELIKN